MKALTKTEIAVMTGRTIILDNVKNIADGTGKSERAVKASSNAKIGKVIARGAWNGAKIYSLTVEERATCNRACLHWADCYGNNMPFATRYVVNDALIQQIEQDLTYYQAQTDKDNARRQKLAAKHGIAFSPMVFAVRLHVLGDFASVEYVEQWAKWFDMFPSLRVWGYTHWNPGTAIGNAILSLREALGGLDARLGGRFCIRFSDETEHGGGALSDTHPLAADMAESGKAFICPEQTGQTKDCGTCALCWTSAKHVIFKTH